MKIPNATVRGRFLNLSLARIVSEDSQPLSRQYASNAKSSKDS